MAIVAKVRDVLMQFMIESIVISIIGGFLGIAQGVLISDVVSQFGGWSVVITGSSILLALIFFSAIVLFLAGILPEKQRP